MHYRARARAKAELVQIVTLERKAAGVLTAVGGEKRKVHITRYGVRRLDADNLYGGAKILVDALRAAGVIWEDDPDHLDLRITQAKTTRGDARTEVEITWDTDILQ